MATMSEPLKYNQVKDVVVKDCDGTEWKMCDLMDRVTLVVDMECSKSWLQNNQECAQLESIYNKFKDRGFEILAFPCDLGREGKMSARDLKQQLVKRHHISFPVMDIVQITDSPHPLFMLIRKKLEQLRESEQLTDKQIGLKWDLSKFLLVDGEPVKQFASTAPFSVIEKEISCALDSECREQCQNPYHPHQQQQQHQFGAESAPCNKTNLRRGEEQMYSGHSARHEQGQDRNPYLESSRDMD